MEVVVREKGRVTLPLILRRRLGLKPGDKIRFDIEHGKIVLKPPREVSARDLYGVLKGMRVRLEDIENAPGADID